METFKEGLLMFFFMDWDALVSLYISELQFDLSVSFRSSNLGWKLCKIFCFYSVYFVFESVAYIDLYKVWGQTC